MTDGVETRRPRAEVAGIAAAARMEVRREIAEPGADLLALIGGRRFATVLADPPWQFVNRTGKMAPEHRRLARYATLPLSAIMALPINELLQPTAHLYLWVPNALLAEGMEVMTRWGFTYKTNLVWYKVRQDGGPDRRGVGFYFRNVTELVLFGTRGRNARTLPPGRRIPNLLSSRKREHSRKPDQLYSLIESCSPQPWLELFARHPRDGWTQWSDGLDAPVVRQWP
ncbi:MAG: MT-A70 family methyltransferase [Rhodospirillales bacterium]